MLEIMQQGGHGYTLRYCEAIAMGKKLATNNPEIEKAPFYNKELKNLILNLFLMVIERWTIIIFQNCLL